MYKRQRRELSPEDAGPKRLRVIKVSPVNEKVPMENVPESNYKMYSAQEVQRLLNQQEKKLKQFYEALMATQQQEFILLLEERLSDQYTMFNTMFLGLSNDMKKPTDFSYIS
jgi:hypothetical protein